MDGDAIAARRIAVLLEYDGTAYCGSQYQENGPSIQSELEAAVNNLTSQSVRAAFAGRTDAGVHALGQVAAFDVSSRLTAAEVARGLNHFLPPDIVVRQARDAAANFDPRRHATRRLYRYRIVNLPMRPAIDRGRVWHVAKPLDIVAMQRAATALEGAHDFAAFAPPFDGRTQRTLQRCEVRARCEQLSIEMEAQAFLPHQVRRTVGPLVEIGLGRMTQEALEAALVAATPSSIGPTAPACGLYLVKVTYDGFTFDPSDSGSE